MQLRKESLKKSGLPGFEPWPLRYRCSALTNWANKPTGSWSLNSFVIHPGKMKMKLWIYEIHIFKLQNEEINVKKILAVINATYAVAKRSVIRRNFCSKMPYSASRMLPQKLYSARNSAGRIYPSLMTWHRLNIFPPWKCWHVFQRLVAIESLALFIFSCAEHLGISSGNGILPTFPHFPSDSFTMLIWVCFGGLRRCAWYNCFPVTVNVWRLMALNNNKTFHLTA